MIAARKRQLELNLALCGKHFLVFFAKFAKNRFFFIQNAVGVTDTKRLALVPRKTLKKVKNDVFATFALKIVRFCWKQVQKR